MLPLHIIQSVKDLWYISRVICTSPYNYEALCQICLESVRKYGLNTGLTETGFDPPESGFDRRGLALRVMNTITLLKPPQCYTETVCHIWFESVHKCFYPPELVFFPIGWPYICYPTNTSPVVFRRFIPIWFESVYTCDHYAGFDPPETGFDPLYLTHRVI
jgi:hypothetical protein